MTTRCTIAMVCAAALVVPGCGRGRRAPDGSGTIEATQVQVSARVPGQLLTLQVEEGSSVVTGDTLASIDATDHALRLDGAKAALAQAQARLDLVLAGARDETIEQARNQVREAQAAENLTDVNFSRARQLFEKGSVTEQQLDEARAAAERAAAALASAQEGLAMLLRGNREQEIRMAQTQVDQVRAEAALAERAVANCSVVSPASGTVTTKISEPGEMVNAGTPIVTVSRLDEVWLSLYVPEYRLSEIALGDTAYVTIDGDKDVYSGVVSFISTEAEFTPRDVQTPDERTKLVYRVKIALPNPAGVFKPGMPADGYVGERP